MSAELKIQIFFSHFLYLCNYNRFDWFEEVSVPISPPLLSELASGVNNQRKQIRQQEQIN